MKTTASEHPDELFLEYLEGSLSPEETMVVQEHLKQCSHCRDRLDELREMSCLLQENRGSLFCPEPWELHELAASHGRPSGPLAEHLEQCSECSRELLEYQTPAKPRRMSTAVEDSFKALAARQQPHEESEPKRGIAAGLYSVLSRLFQVPVLSLASAAAAAVLLVVFLYPHGESQPMLGLSDVQWSMPVIGPKGTPKSLVAVDKPRVAMLLWFERFAKPPSRDLVDRLYRGLQPSEQLRGMFDFVSPHRVKASLGGRPIDRETNAELTDQLRRTVDVSRVLILSVATRGDQCQVSGEAFDAKTGTSLERITLPEANVADLEATVRDAAFTLLNAIRPGER